MSETAKVILRRPGRIVGCAVSMNVLIDGKQVGSLGNDGTLTLDVPAGSHVLTGKTLGGGTNIIHLELAPGDTCELTCTLTWGTREALATFLPVFFLAVNFGVSGYLADRMPPGAGPTILIIAAILLLGAMLVIVGGYFKKWGMVAFDIQPVEPGNPAVRIENANHRAMWLQFASWAVLGCVSVLAVVALVFWAKGASAH